MKKNLQIKLDGRLMAGGFFDTDADLNAFIDAEREKHARWLSQEQAEAEGLNIANALAQRTVPIESGEAIEYKFPANLQIDIKDAETSEEVAKKLKEKQVKDKLTAIKAGDIKNVQDCAKAIENILAYLGLMQ